MMKINVQVKGQCSELLKAALKDEEDYEAKDGKQDILWLLEILKELISGLVSKGNKRSNFFDALLAFITVMKG